MRYFKYFPRTFYKFGNETTEDAIENISIYSDVIDQVKDATTAYQDYYIQNNERPDQVSMRLYDKAEYHWTFFLMNEKLRESGWPLAPGDVFNKAKRVYSSTVITTKTFPISTTFKINQTLNGLGSGATAQVKHRELDLGQIWIKNATGTFVAGETVTSVNTLTGATESLVIDSVAPQYNAAHHYENADKEYVDINPGIGPGSSITKITWLEFLNGRNEELRQIRVIEPGSINQLVEAFREAVSI